MSHRLVIPEELYARITAHPSLHCLADADVPTSLMKMPGYQATFSTGSGLHVRLVVQRFDSASSIHKFYDRVASGLSGTVAPLSDVNKASGVFSHHLPTAPKQTLNVPQLPKQTTGIP